MQSVRERESKMHTSREKIHELRTAPERQKDKKKREIQLPWLPFCSCHWLSHCLLAPLALSSIVFSSFLLFLLPFPTQYTWLSGWQDCRGIKTTESFFLYHSIVIVFSSNPKPHNLILFSCSYLLLYDLLFYISYRMLCFSGIYRFNIISN